MKLLLDNKEHWAGVRRDLREEVEGCGKFEGEALYSPFFYEAFTAGEGEDLAHGDGQVIELHYTDHALFPELEGYNFVICYEDDNGFFYTVPVKDQWGLITNLSLLSKNPDKPTALSLLLLTREKNWGGITYW